jgi:ribonuclease HI
MPIKIIKKNTYIHACIHTYIHTYILEKHNWTVIYTWIKAHAGNYGKRLADKLANEAARNDDMSFNRMPKSEIVQQVRDQSVVK